MTAATTTRIYLVRHGETNWNRAQRLQGVVDVPLNRAGIIQAWGLAARFRPARVSSIVTSPLLRAYETASILSSTRACSLHTDSRLREIDHGELTGFTMRDIRRRSSDLVSLDRLLPAAFDSRGGEAPTAVYRRASAALGDVLNAHAGASVVVVGHGVTNAMLWCAATGAPLSRFHEWLQPNTGAMALTFRGRALVAARTADAVEHLA